MNKLSLMMYVELDVLCLILLTYVACKSLTNIERRQSWQYFQMSVYFILGFVASDLVWILVENRVLPNTPFLNYLINCIYFVFSVGATSLWFYYTETELNSKLAGVKLFMVFTALPFVAMVILLVVSYTTGILFYFDSEGRFIRGPHNYLAFAIPCFYLMLSTVRALCSAMLKKNYANAKSYLSLASFSLVTLSASVLQFFIPGSPLPCIGITIAVMLVYMSSQELLVSLDPLTKLNNRYQMVRYLTNKMDKASEAEPFYLIMLDLDKFKQINDTYGHIEGDKALVQLADVLKQVSTVFNCFVSRYGGDEFIIAYEPDGEDKIDSIHSFIQGKLDEYNNINNNEYNISISMGCAKYNNGIRYVPDFIALADKALYEIKKSKNV